MEIRELQNDELYLLEDFLYETIFQKEGTPSLPRNIIFQPEINIYIKDFGNKPHDICLVASIKKQIVGMVWTRIITGFGNVDNETPELAISIKKAFRGQGIGKKLMFAILATLRNQNYKQVSLSVQKENFALKLYQDLGFQIVTEHHNEVIMLYSFKK